MVEQQKQLNRIFGSLSDPTRRDILKRISRQAMNVGQIAQHYDLTFAAVAKHLSVLEGADLIRKTRQGKTQIVTLYPKSLAAANNYLENYRQLWENRLDSLNKYLKLTSKNKKG